MSRPAGIDVSGNNGEINWLQWHNKISFAEIKATESVTFKDEAFAFNWKRAKNIGLLRFAYHYGHPGKSPADQARFFTDEVRSHGLEDNDHFVLDLEVSDGLPALHVSFWAVTFCHEMNRLNPGHRIIVQSFPSFIKAGNTAGLKAWHLWTMNWDVAEPEIPVGPWKTWAFWQYREGKNGEPDLDVFNGSHRDLEKFCHTTG